MNKIDFIYIPLSQNLIQSVLDGTSPDNTVYVFPSEKSKHVALREFQKNWDFSNTHFTTMEHLKERLFRSANPILKEEKRTLAFYQSLNEKDKDSFNVHSYFQSIDFAQNFFKLWEEFNEELVEDKNNLAHIEDMDAGIHEWQIETLQRLLEIRSRYFSFIKSKGFNDVIFSYRHQKINLDAYKDISNFIFVNQFYYTGLEKKALSFLVENNRSVNIFYQLPPSLVDENNLKVKYFSFDQLGHSRLQKINVVETQNDFSTLAQLFSRLEKENDVEIIDASASLGPFDNFLNIKDFQTNESGLIRNTFLYDFFYNIYKLLDGSVFDPGRKKWLLPIGLVLNTCMNSDFAAQIFSGIQQKDNLSQEEVLEEISRLLDSQFKYVDSDLELFKHVVSPKFQITVKTLFGLLLKFTKAQSIPSLLDLLDTENGITIKTLITKEQQECSNIEEVFYQALYDFKTLHDINIVENWGHLFTKEKSSDKPTLAIGILKLFLDYLRPKRFWWNYDTGKTVRANFGNLLDSRNIQYDKIIVLNVIEDQLPHASQTPFLFTDNQRKLLGLKTFEDIKLWEKYYFFRLLLNAKSTTLFTQKNVDSNTAPSSFLEEIKLVRFSENLSYKTVGDLSYRTLYETLLHPDTAFAIGPNITSRPNFYKLPLDKTTDFPNNRLDASYYATKHLLQNPFSFYINHIAGLTEKIKEVKEEFSKPLVGNIVHDVLNSMWNLFEDQSAAPMFGYNFGDINNTLIDRSLKFVMEKRGKLYFQIPHNYSFIYFQKIIVPLIIDRILFFFDFLKNSPLQGHNLKVIPEKEFANAEERERKCLVSANENDLHIKVNVRGRADLRIEDSDTQEHFIFDYKTGGMDKEQLVFYELFYYLLDQSTDADKINSYFFHVFNKEIKSLKDLYRKGASKESMVDLYKNSVIDAVNILSENGFCLPQKRTYMDKLEDISRKDLYLTNLKNFNAPELY
jgi:hypothetical protein